MHGSLLEGMFRRATHCETATSGISASHDVKSAGTPHARPASRFKPIHCCDQKQPP